MFLPCTKRWKISGQNVINDESSTSQYTYYFIFNIQLVYNVASLLQMQQASRSGIFYTLFATNSDSRAEFWRRKRWFNHFRSTVSIKLSNKFASFIPLLIKSLIFSTLKKNELTKKRSIWHLRLYPKISTEAKYVKIGVCTYNWIQVPRVATRSSLLSPHEYRQVQGCLRGLGSLKTAALCCMKERDSSLSVPLSYLRIRAAMPRADTHIVLKVHGTLPRYVRIKRWNVFR